MKILGMGIPELSVFLIGALIAVAFGYGTAKIASKKGYSYGGFFVAGFILGVIGLVIALVLPDKTPTDTPASAADDLLKYKELLDAGAITQEEFDAKKTELLSAK